LLSALIQKQPFLDEHEKTANPWPKLFLAQMGILGYFDKFEFLFNENAVFHSRTEAIKTPVRKGNPKYEIFHGDRRFFPVEFKFSIIGTGD
jgi:hypothetical protein